MSWILTWLTEPFVHKAKGRLSAKRPTIRKTGAEGSSKAPALTVCSVIIIAQTPPAQTTETATITATLWGELTAPPTESQGNLAQPATSVNTEHPCFLIRIVKTGTQPKRPSSIEYMQKIIILFH